MRPCLGGRKGKRKTYRISTMKNWAYTEQRVINETRQNGKNWKVKAFVSHIKFQLHTWSNDNPWKNWNVFVLNTFSKSRASLGDLNVQKPVLEVG